MLTRRTLLATFAAFAAPIPASAQSTGAFAAARELSGQHPAAYYRKAAELLASDRKDDAVFAFYLGQLRFRTHLMARPELPPSGDKALFASLSEVVGRPVNEYAFGDLPALARVIDAVLAWDARNPDTFTPPSRYAPAHNSVRQGLASMRAQIIRDADSIRAQRKSNGLPNRT